MSNWTKAKKDLTDLGIRINTKIKSCEFGCACMGDDWAEQEPDKPRLWQTGKRFGARGGYLNHANLSDAHKWQIMATLNAHAIAWEWDGADNHTILIDLGSN